MTFCYWDGSDKKKQLIVRKGDSVRDVIQKCLRRIEKLNKDLVGATADTFMMIKADYILPNHILIMDYLTQQRNDGKCE